MNTLHYVVISNRISSVHRNLKVAESQAAARGGIIFSSDFSFRRPVVITNPDGSIKITEGWTPPAAERIAFLNRLKAQLLDRTTALGFSQEQVMQLAAEMQHFSLLADIGADETLYYAIQNLPSYNPVIFGETKDWLLAEIRAYIQTYKPDFE